jgi:hypothetical protein
VLYSVIQKVAEHKRKPVADNKSVTELPE